MGSMKLFAASQFNRVDGRHVLPAVPPGALAVKE